MSDARNPYRPRNASTGDRLAHGVPQIDPRSRGR
jgi:hypothetical protein